MNGPTISGSGKTGTTSDNRELWFVGTTTRYSAAIFIGHDSHSKVIDANSVVFWAPPAHCHRIPKNHGIRP